MTGKGSQRALSVSILCLLLLLKLGGGLMGLHYTIMYAILCA